MPDFSDVSFICSSWTPLFLIPLYQKMTHGGKIMGPVLRHCFQHLDPSSLKRLKKTPSLKRLPGRRRRRNIRRRPPSSRLPLNQGGGGQRRSQRKPPSPQDRAPGGANSSLRKIARRLSLTKRTSPSHSTRGENQNKSFAKRSWRKLTAVWKKRTRVDHLWRVPPPAFPPAWAKFRSRSTRLLLKPP